jgi:hypothetical protein
MLLGLYPGTLPAPHASVGWFVAGHARPGPTVRWSVRGPLRRTTGADGNAPIMAKSTVAGFLLDRLLQGQAREFTNR